MLKRNQRIASLVFLTVLMLACAPLATPYAPPTFDLLQVNTIIAETAGAAATQTFVLLPTVTITPTFTRVPSETPSPTNTIIFSFATSTPIPSETPVPTKSSDPYACVVLSQTPADGTSFVPGLAFQARWQVKNIGLEVWGVNTADYRYVGGDKFHKAPVYDMPTSVPPGEKADITVEMWAPMDPGNYTTTWKIKVGKTEFCTMKLNITVT